MSSYNPQFAGQEVKQKGTALYLAVFSMSLILGIAFGINILLINQVKTLRSLGFSVFAFGAADAGIEKIFYDDQRGINVLDQCPEGRPPPDPSKCTQTLSNGATFTISVTGQGPGCPGTTYCAKSLGSYQDARRAIRIAR